MNTGTASKNAWIIGASSGIGRALALELAGCGYRLALSARRTAELQELQQGLPGQGHLVLPLDVTDRQATRDAARAVAAHWETLHSMIFMAGIYTPMALARLDPEETEAILRVNLHGAFHAVAEVLPLLLQQGEGQIALCGSVAGYRGLPRAQPYGATKAALINLAETLRLEHGDQLDIRLINPGFVKSRMTDKNDFHMPARISAKEAARSIARGLERPGFEIHFPRRFTLWMKLLRLLPDALYFRIAGKRKRPGAD